MRKRVDLRDSMHRAQPVPNDVDHIRDSRIVDNLKNRRQNDYFLTKSFTVDNTKVCLHTELGRQQRRSNRIGRI